jgi:rhodanese-related sulfurtransferase
MGRSLPTYRTYRQMKESYRTAFAEATMILVAAIMLGFVYTGVTRKGLFRASSPSSPAAAPEASASTFLTYEEAQGLYIRQRAVFVDARHAFDFNRGHIKGAVNIPLSEAQKNHGILEGLPKDRMLVVYCDGESCNSSVELAKLLYGAGFSNVKVFFGGWNEWLAHKQPREP